MDGLAAHPLVQITCGWSHTVGLTATGKVRVCVFSLLASPAASRLTSDETSACSGEKRTVCVCVWLRQTDGRTDIRRGRRLAVNANELCPRYCCSIYFFFRSCLFPVQSASLLLPVCLPARLSASASLLLIISTFRLASFLGPGNVNQRSGVHVRERRSRQAGPRRREKSVGAHPRGRPR